MTHRPFNVAVFASGGGTNFQALLDHQAVQDLWRVRILVMNREAGAADRAAKAGVPVRVVPTRGRDEEEIAAETLAVLAEFDVDIVLLAGYLRHVPGQVIDRYRGRMLNIHPALLPEFGGPGMYGMHVHRAVVDSGVDVTGATVHFVTAAYDEGDILGQWRISRIPANTPEQVAERVLAVEHQLYPRAVDHLCAALRAGTTPERMADLWLDEPPAGERPAPHLTGNEEEK